MALKPQRKYTVGTDVSYFMNATAERGGMVAYLTSGSGAAMDDSNAVVRPTGSATSGVAMAGLLLNDMVNLDLTRQHINWHKDEVQLGGKVTVLRQGEVVTNVLETGAIRSTISAGVGAYVASQTFNGNANVFVLTPTNPNTNTTTNDTVPQRVGTFKSSIDEDGYAKVEINL